MHGSLGTSEVWIRDARCARNLAVSGGCATPTRQPPLPGAPPPTAHPMAPAEMLEASGCKPPHAVRVPTSGPLKDVITHWGHGYAVAQIADIESTPDGVRRAATAHSPPFRFQDGLIRKYPDAGQTPTPSVHCSEVCSPRYRRQPGHRPFRREPPTRTWAEPASADVSAKPRQVPPTRLPRRGRLD